MTDKIENHSEIDEIVAAVKSHTDGIAEGKADKAEVEAIKELIPSLEGVAKQDVLDELEGRLTKGMEDLGAVVKAASPASAPVADATEIKFVEGKAHNAGSGAIVDKAGAAYLGVEIAKAFGSTGSTAQVEGSPTAAQRLYHQMQQRNPYRMVSTIMPTSAGSVNLPEITSITAAVENTVPNNSPTGTPGGDIDSVNVIPQNWVSRNQFSDQSVEDHPGLDQMVASFMAQAIARAEAADMVTQLDDNTNVGEENTGAANALPTSINAWTDLMASLDSAYRENAKWVMSREAYANLRSLTAGTSGDFAFDPVLGKQTFLGYEITINDHHDAGSADDQNPVYFGDFSMGTIIVSRKELQISRHEDTVPGAMYYYGNMRSRGVVWDADAIVRFNVGA